MQSKQRIDAALLKIRFSERTAPLAILIALILSFGLLIPRLGIYQDDWVFFYNAYRGGPQGLWNFFYYDGSPFSAYLNTGLFLLLGYKPLAWHIASLLARWLTVTVCWLVFRQLWPAHPRQTFFAALIFAIHPFFVLQPMAFTYLHVWIGYLFLALSFWFMLLSVRNPGRFGVFLVLSLSMQAAAILTGEYFAGLEFIRPILVWIALGGQEKNWQKRSLRALRLWIPYLLLFGLYLYWRFVIYDVPIKNRNQPVLIEALLKDPVNGLKLILFNLIPDSLLIVIASWYKLIDPFGFDFNNRTNLLLSGLAFLTAILFLVYFLRQQFGEQRTEQSSRPWALSALWLGLAILVFGLIPPYIGGYFINDKNFLWNSRFGMASMLGAALISAALLEVLVTSLRARLIVLAIVVGLSSAWHMRYTNDFRHAWSKELNLYRQLSLRIPSLEPGTALVAEGEILSFMGDYPTAYAVNTLYSQSVRASTERADYWYFGITTNFGTRLEEFMQGSEIQERHRSVVFIGRSDQSLIISFEPETGKCLWVIRPQDSSGRVLPSLLQQAAPLSDLSRIQTGSDQITFLKEILGASYADDWCSHYAQADLARQLMDWEKVIQIWDSANQSHLTPENGFELLPFIEAYANLDRWEEALEVARLAEDAPPSTRYTICDFWRQLPASPQRESTFQTLESDFACSGG